MVKFISDFLGMKIILFQEQAILSSISGYIISPKNGDLLGFEAKNPLTKKIMVIPSNEIRTIGPDFIMINGLDSMSEIKDVIRIEEAKKIDPKLIKERVVTESGKKIGKVENATYDMTYLKLDKLYVVPALSLQKLTRELIIPAKKIVEINKTKITIEDDPRVKNKVPHNALIRAKI